MTTSPFNNFRKTSVLYARQCLAENILGGFADKLNDISVTPDFGRAVEALLRCDGKVITTGMGKAGIAMKKFSSLLCSLGFPSCYLHPGEASHGDLGMLGPHDLLFVASTSGKTREVMEIMQLARNVGVETIIGITSHPDSPVREQTDIVIDMGVIKEAGDLGLAPTTSILVMLALTDALAIIASQEKNLTKEEYGKYHHSGYLGQKARNEVT